MHLGLQSNEEIRKQYVAEFECRCPLGECTLPLEPKYFHLHQTERFTTAILMELLCIIEVFTTLKLPLSRIGVFVASPELNTY